jgi:uncharacterized protein YndB with AHSA1/START domain
MSQQDAIAKSTLTTPAKREIRVERVFEAPRERVFAAHTDPELIARWWGPFETETIVEELDPRPGGRWRFVVRNSDGSETGFRGVYRELVVPERIVQTFEWDGLPGHVSVDAASFEDLGERTRVVSTTLFHTTEERDGMIESGMEKGLNESHVKLDQLLAAEPSA